MIRHLWCRAHYKTPGCRRSRTFYVKLPLYLIQSDPIRIGSIHLLRTRVISITYDVLLGADLNFEHSRDKVNQFFMCFTLAVQLHTQKVPLWIICAAFDFRYLHFFVRFEFGCRLLSVTGSFFSVAVAFSPEAKYVAFVDYYLSYFSYLFRNSSFICGSLFIQAKNNHINESVPFTRKNKKIN